MASRAVGAADPSADVPHAAKWEGYARNAPTQGANHFGRATSFSHPTSQDQSATVIGAHLKRGLASSHPPASSVFLQLPSSCVLLFLPPSPRPFLLSPPLLPLSLSSASSLSHF